MGNYFKDILSDQAPITRMKNLDERLAKDSLLI